MKIEIVTPAPRGSRKGNRVTALRWAGILRSLGHHVRLETEHRAEDAALVVVLHARRGHAALDAAKRERPRRPVFVAVTGTDLYVDGIVDDLVRDSLVRADRVLVLQPRALEALPPAVRRRAAVVRQSCSPPEPAPRRADDGFEVVVVGHLRAVKDPFLAAEAARLLPESSAIRIVHLGEALTPEVESRAREEERTNRRYRWLGGLIRSRTLARIAAARLLVLTSRAEGGAQVISEALVCGTPVLATRIDGVVGLLGDDWPGLFPVGDAEALSKLLTRAETDPSFLADLSERAAAIAPLYAPAAERATWVKLLDSAPDEPGDP